MVFRRQAPPSQAGLGVGEAAEDQHDLHELSPAESALVQSGRASVTRPDNVTATLGRDASCVMSLRHGSISLATIGGLPAWSRTKRLWGRQRAVSVADAGRTRTGTARCQPAWLRQLSAWRSSLDNRNHP